MTTRSQAGAPITDSVIIRYRRPEAPWSVVKMVVPGGEDEAAVQINRLKALGYSIIDVVPAEPPSALTPRSDVRRS